MKVLRKKKNLITTNKKEGDFLMAALVFALSLFGCVMVYSASYYNDLSKYGDPYVSVRSDLMWFGIGWAAFIFFAIFDLRVLKIFAYPILGVGIVLLLLLFTPLGHTINNATRWIGVGGFTVMPGEIIKFCLIIAIARYFSDDPERIRSITKGIIPIVALAAVIGLLIIKQPNLSTAGIVVLLIIGMAFVAGLGLGWVALGCIGLAGGFIAIIFSPKGAYMLKRVNTWFDPFKDPQGDGYQVVQGLMALGSGGVKGVGLGQSMQKMLYLPEPMNDFILAIIGEELGFIGVAVLIAAFMLLIWRLCKITIHASDYFSFLVAAGITILLSLQVILNIAVVSATFFPTGIVLPFITLGGNAMLIFLSLMGIMFNISRHNEM